MVMSEEKSQWASMETVADMLTAADSIGRIEFYVTKYDNKPAELKCRIFNLTGMNKIDVESLALKLNEAISPVLQSTKGTLQNKAANQLRRFL